MKKINYKQKKQEDKMPITSIPMTGGTFGQEQIIPIMNNYPYSQFNRTNNKANIITLENENELNESYYLKSERYCFNQFNEYLNGLIKVALYHPEKSKIVTLLYYYIFIVVICSVLSTCFETVNSFSKTDTQKKIFKYLECFFTINLLLDWFIRFFTYPYRASKNTNGSNNKKNKILKKTRLSKYIGFININSIIDFLGAIPFFIELIFPITELKEANGWCWITLLLRNLRIIRLFRLLYYSNTTTSKQMVIIKKAIHRSSDGITMIFWIFTTLCIFFSSLYFLAEVWDCELDKDTNLWIRYKGDDFEICSVQSVVDSFWWSVVTLSTLGYGDYTPLTTLGKIIGSIAIVFALFVFSLPTTIVSANLTELISENRREEAINKALARTDRKIKRAMEKRFDFETKNMFEPLPRKAPLKHSQSLISSRAIVNEEIPFVNKSSPLRNGGINISDTDSVDDLQTNQRRNMKAPSDTNLSSIMSTNSNSSSSNNENNFSDKSNRPILYKKATIDEVLDEDDDDDEDEDDKDNNINKINSNSNSNSNNNSSSSSDRIFNRLIKRNGKKKNSQNTSKENNKSKSSSEKNSKEKIDESKLKNSQEEVKQNKGKKTETSMDISQKKNEGILLNPFQVEKDTTINDNLSLLPQKIIKDAEKIESFSKKDKKSKASSLSPNKDEKIKKSPISPNNEKETDKSKTLLIKGKGKEIENENVNDNENVNVNDNINVNINKNGNITKNINENENTNKNDANELNCDISEKNEIKYNNLLKSTTSKPTPTPTLLLAPSSEASSTSTNVDTKSTNKIPSILIKNSALTLPPSNDPKMIIPKIITVNENGEIEHTKKSLLQTANVNSFLDNNSKNSNTLGLANKSIASTSKLNSMANNASSSKLYAKDSTKLGQMSSSVAASMVIENKLNNYHTNSNNNSISPFPKSYNLASYGNAGPMMNSANPLFPANSRKYGMGREDPMVRSQILRNNNNNMFPRSMMKQHDGFVSQNSIEMSMNSAALNKKLNINNSNTNNNTNTTNTNTNINTNTNTNIALGSIASQRIFPDVTNSSSDYDSSFTSSDGSSYTDSDSDSSSYSESDSDLMKNNGSNPFSTNENDRNSSHHHHHHHHHHEGDEYSHDPEYLFKLMMKYCVDCESEILDLQRKIQNLSILKMEFKREIAMIEKKQKKDAAEQQQSLNK